MMKTKINKTADGALKSKAVSQKVLEQAIQSCKKYGASDATVDFHQEQGFEVDVRLGEVDSVSFHQKQGLSVVVYCGLRKGIASSTDLSTDSIDMIAKAACDMAKVSAEDPCYGLADARIWQTLKDLELDLYHPWQITPEMAIEKAIELETLARQQDKRITNSDGANISSYEGISACMNTRGFHQYTKSTSHGMNCSLIAKQGEEMQTDYAFTAARNAKNLDAVEDLAKLVAKRTCERLGARTIATGKLPVIFSNRLSGGLIGQFISAISGLQLYRKNSFLCDSIGLQLFPEFMHIHEQPHLPGAYGSACYDSDGIPTANNVFVEQGIIQQYLLGVYSARRLKLSPTGNADGTHNLTVKANAGDLSDLLKQMGKGLLITQLMGQGVNILTGDYSRGVSGFWIENGQIQYPVEGVTIAGNLKNMFKQIIAVGDDINKNYTTKCGSILIEEMMVAGH